MRLDLYQNVNTKQILKAIGIKENDIPRLRGVGIDDGKILIHTRTGGGNRDQYDSVENYINGEYGLQKDLDALNDKKSWDYGYYLKHGGIKKNRLELEKRITNIIATKTGTNELLRDNPYFIFDEDEEFDCTYANFWFRIPEKFTEKLLKLEDKKSKAILGDGEIAIGLMFGDKKAIKKAKDNLKKLKI